MSAGRALSVLVHADTKVGKSTFANTAPAPRLMLDAEAAYRFLPGTKVMWDPMRDNPPTYDGSWETCVVVVRDWSTVERVYEWLNQGQHPFKSLIIDSITEIQVKCKDAIQSGSIDMDQRRWGELLTRMERLVRGFRDLTEHPYHPLEAVVITSMTQMRDGKWRPYVQGALMTKLPYFIDVIGYMYVDQVQPEDPTQPAVPVRKLLVVPHAQYEAGERVQGRLPGIVVNPSVTGMLDSVFGPTQS